MICQQCNDIAERQWRAKGKELEDWRDLYRMHLFYAHHNPVVVFTEKETSNEVSEMPETSKEKHT